MAITAAAADSTIAFHLHLQSYSCRGTNSGSTVSSSEPQWMAKSSRSWLSSSPSPSTRRGSAFWRGGLGVVDTAMERAVVGTIKTNTTTTKTATATAGNSKRGERSGREINIKKIENRRWRFSAPPGTSTKTPKPPTTKAQESHLPSPPSSVPASSSLGKIYSLPWPSTSPPDPNPAKMRFLKRITHTFSSTKNTKLAPESLPPPLSPPHSHSPLSSFSPSESASSLSTSPFSSSFSTHFHSHSRPSSGSRCPSTSPFSSSSLSASISIIYTRVSFRLPFFRRTPAESQQEFKIVPLPARPGVIRDRCSSRAMMVPVEDRGSRNGGERWDGEGRGGWDGREVGKEVDAERYESEGRYDSMGEEYRKDHVVVMPEMQHLSMPYEVSGSDTSRVSIPERKSVGDTWSHKSVDSRRNLLSSEKKDIGSTHSRASVRARDRDTPIPASPRLASRNPYRRFEPISTPAAVVEHPRTIALEHEIPEWYRRRLSPHQHHQRYPHSPPVDTPSLHQLLSHLSRLSRLFYPTPDKFYLDLIKFHDLLFAHLPDASLIPPVCNTLLNLRSHQEKEFLKIRERWIRMLEGWLDDVKGFHGQEELEGAFLGAVVLDEEEVVVKGREVSDTLEEGKVEGRVGRGRRSEGKGGGSGRESGRSNREGGVGVLY